MEIYDVALIPLIVGVVQLCKIVGLPVKFAAVVSVLLGIAVGMFYLAPDDLAKGLLLGASLGLAASGLYSTTKNTIEGVTKA